MQNTYNEIGDTSVIFLHAREYLSYSLAMEKCWSNARILHRATMEKSVIFKPFNYVVWFIIAIASFSTELGVVVYETCCQQASTAACLNALCVTSSLAASLWCLPCVTTIPSHACFENSACDPPSSLLIVICHHSSLVIADSCFASCDLFFAILKSRWIQPPGCSPPPDNTVYSMDVRWPITQAMLTQSAALCPC